MKLAPRELTRWLADKRNAARAVLFHGEDRGSVSELARRVASATVADLNDPFAVALLDADALKGETARLNDELFGLSPMGGGKLVWFRDAADRHASLIEDVLNGPPPPAGNLLLLEAGELTFRSNLRRLFEGAKSAISVQCDGQTGTDAEGLIREALAAEGLSIAPDALGALARRLGSDRALLRRALEVLVLFKWESKGEPVTLNDVLATTGDAEALGIEDVVDSLLTGSRRAIDRSYGKALEAGASPVGVLRAALRIFQRIALVSGLMEQGASADQALGELIPPIPYSTKSAFLAACRRWSPKSAQHALSLISEAEAQCKTTGLPEDVVCGQTLLRLAVPMTTARVS